MSNLPIDEQALLAAEAELTNRIKDSGPAPTEEDANRLIVSAYLAEAGFMVERRMNDDGRGSDPPHPDDRPCSESRRLVSPWRRVSPRT